MHQTFAFSSEDYALFLCRTEVYSNPTPPCHDDNEKTKYERTRTLNRSDRIFTVECEIVQHYSLGNESGDGSDLYFECCGSEECSLLHSACVEHGNGHLFVKLVSDNDSMHYQNEIGHDGKAGLCIQNTVEDSSDNIEGGENVEKGVPLSALVSRVRSDANNEGLESNMREHRIRAGSDLYACGENHCSCLVSGNTIF